MILGIVKNDLVGYEKGLVCVRHVQTEQGESSRQTCHGAKHNDTAYYVMIIFCHPILDLVKAWKMIPKNCTVPSI